MVPKTLHVHSNYHSGSDKYDLSTGHSPTAEMFQTSYATMEAENAPANTTTCHSTCLLGGGRAAQEVLFLYSVSVLFLSCEPGQSCQDSILRHIHASGEKVYCSLNRPMFSGRWTCPNHIRYACYHMHAGIRTEEPLGTVYMVMMQNMYPACVDKQSATCGHELNSRHVV
jgi:hypothetical protein